MNEFDQALAYGFVAGISTICIILLGLHVAKEEGDSDARIGRTDDKDSPFAPTPTATETFRTARVCRDCNRYIGPDRRLLGGQRLNVIPTLCPICARRVASLQTAV